MEPVHEQPTGTHAATQDLPMRTILPEIRFPDSDLLRRYYTSAFAELFKEENRNQLEAFRSDFGGKTREQQDEALMGLMFDEFGFGMCMDASWAHRRIRLDRTLLFCMHG
jgi:hypothetical protein